MRSERGQASIEWVGLVLLASIALGALATVVPVIDGRSFGGFLSEKIACAVKGASCEDGDAQLARAYGQRDADLVRRYAPNLVYEDGEAQIPVDYRECRSVRCANAPLGRDLDVHRSNAGRRATVFTRVIRRNGRTYIQYWFYYPDSNSTFTGSRTLWNASPLWARRLVEWKLGRRGYPGYHKDDWEGYAVRLGRDGRAAVRSTSHRGWQYCKQASCRGMWGSVTGWTRVSRGSHAGHVPLERTVLLALGGRVGERRRLSQPLRPIFPGRDFRERTSTSAGLRLVPLERLDQRRYVPLDPQVSPPWRKEAYRSPETPRS